MEQLEGESIPGQFQHSIYPMNGAKLADGIWGKGLAFEGNTHGARVDLNFQCFQDGLSCSDGMCVGFWIKLGNEGTRVTSVFSNTLRGDERIYRKRNILCGC